MMSSNSNTDIESNILQNQSLNNDIRMNRSRNDLFENEQESSNKTGIYCLKFIGVFLILLFTLPIIFADLYYAYNDNSCVSSHVDRLNVNLKEYLQVSGFLNMGAIFLVVLALLLYNDKTKGFLLTFGTMLLIFIGVFNTVWNIIGGVIFWKYMDNTLCSNAVFNYVFTSLIIKYVFTVFNLKTNNKKD